MDLSPLNGSVGKAIGVADDRPIVIYGRDAAGKIVAEDRTDSHWKAKQIADGWRRSGLEVATALHTRRPDATGRVAFLAGNG